LWDDQAPTSVNAITVVRRGVAVINEMRVTCPYRTFWPRVTPGGH